jgi:hypothetical protein
MKIFLILLIVLLVCSTTQNEIQEENINMVELKKHLTRYPKNNGGGITCVVCTIAMRILQQIATQEGNIRRAIERVCSLLPPQFLVPCRLFMAAFSTIIIEEFERGGSLFYNIIASPDRVCQALTICTNNQCLLFPRTVDFVKPFFLK